MEKLNRWIGKIQDLISGMENQSKRNKRGREREQFFHLDEGAISRLESIAGKRNLAMQSALEEAVYFYYSQQGEQQPKRVSEERKERNPLLRLEGLLSEPRQSKIQGSELS